jgi:glycosyltransferase involved in cell wall biosynthesis
MTKGARCYSTSDDRSSDHSPPTPLVTVVIPTYNYAHFLIETLESALAQTYSNFEIIVVDDGSTDDTRKILDPYWERIRYIHQANQGLSAARNTGIRAARGDLIALLDSDDIWHPRKLEIQVDYLRECPENGLFVSDDIARFYGKSAGSNGIEEPPKSWAVIESALFSKASSLSLEEIVISPPFSSCGVLIRKECFETVGYFDTSLRSCEDRDMWIRIASRYGVVRLQLPLWWYRQHSGSMITFPGLMEDTELRVLRKSFKCIDVLRHRVFLQRKAFSRALYSSAVRYTTSGMQFCALTRIARSLLMWPLPYRRTEVKFALARLKSLVVILLRLLRLKSI